ncbi:hypothetical protein D3C84_563520 [compost metagenome]
MNKDLDLVLTDSDRQQTGFNILARTERNHFRQLEKIIQVMKYCQALVRQRRVAGTFTVLTGQRQVHFVRLVFHPLAQLIDQRFPCFRLSDQLLDAMTLFTQRDPFFVRDFRPSLAFESIGQFAGFLLGGRRHYPIKIKHHVTRDKLLLFIHIR